MYTDLTSPEAYNTPENAVLTRLLVKLLNDYLNPLAYPAELAGLHYSLSNTASGVQLAAYGFNHKLGVLLEKVLEHLVGFHVKDDRFAVRASILGLDLSPRDIPWRYRPRVEPGPCCQLPCSLAHGAALAIVF